MSIFRLILLKPPHYDDDGHIIQRWRSGIPSNTLAALYVIARDAAERRELGYGVELRISAIDETNTHIRARKLGRVIERDGGMGVVCLVGVRSNQFPRAMDIARGLRAQGIQVAMGGFHVSGTLAMLPEATPEVQQAMELGVCLYAGETEGRFDELLLDAHAGRLKPLYDYLNDLPSVDRVAPPFTPREYVERTVGTLSSFDAGRGCRWTDCSSTA